MTNKTPAEKFADFAKKQSELDISKAFLGSAISTSSVIDKTAGYLLAGIGATTALIVSNLDRTAAFIGIGAVRMVLLLLIASGLFGLLQKYMALVLQVWLTVEDEVKKSVGAVLKSHSEKEQRITQLTAPGDPVVEATIDFTSSLKEIESVVPWHKRSAFKRNMKLAESDPLSGHRKAARLYNRQVFYAMAELVTAISAILVVAFSI